MDLICKDNVGIIMIDSPNNNSMDHAFLKESMRLFDEAKNTESIRAVVFTSTQSGLFCAGMNPFVAIEFSHEEMYQFIHDLNLLSHKMFGFSKPTVAAINGHALGGGCILTLTADYRIMAKGNFRIGVIEGGLGMAMPFGLIRMFEYVMGSKTGERSVLTAQKYSPEQAMEIGMVDEVMEPEDLLAGAIEKAKALGEKPAMAYRITKEYFRKAVLDWMESEKPYHLKEWVGCWFSKDCQKLIGNTIKNLTKK